MKKKAQKKSPAKGSHPTPDAGRTPREVTRYIKPHVQYMLWGKAAGRCQFDGCNKQLWKSPVTQEQVNIAEKAHIYAFSEDGARGHAGISEDELNDIGNLMLVCTECHETIDREKDGGRYPASLLLAWKEAHERRIEIVTGIDPQKKSHILLYGARIGDQNSPLRYAVTAPALFPDRYPADDKPLAIDTIDGHFNDRSPSFWTVEAESLKGRFTERVRPLLSRGEIGHLSVFALAPQPLLVLLGTLLSDIPDVDVFQLHREPRGWEWPGGTVAAPFLVHEPTRTDGPPALVLSLSAPVTPDRITAVLGENASIWTVTIPSPNNDFTKSRSQLSEFRTLARQLIDRIKAVHGQTTPLHVFPAASVSVAVELGRIRMPKAHMPWKLYDQVNDLGGFIHALTIGEMC